MSSLPTVVPFGAKNDRRCGTRAMNVRAQKLAISYPDSWMRVRQGSGYEIENLANRDADLPWTAARSNPPPLVSVRRHYHPVKSSPHIRLFIESQRKVFFLQPCHCASLERSVRRRNAWWPQILFGAVGQRPEILTASELHPLPLSPIQCRFGAIHKPSNILWGKLAS